MLVVRIQNRENVSDKRTCKNEIETDKNTGENAKRYACVDYEQILTVQ